MHYDSIENKHGLKHDPFKALVAPRPIGWISSVAEDGTLNLAPYSFFNAVADRPHYVMFTSVHRKDSLRNIEANGEFTCSLSTWDTRAGMNISSAPARKRLWLASSASSILARTTGWGRSASWSFFAASRNCGASCWQ